MSIRTLIAIGWFAGALGVAAAGCNKAGTGGGQQTNPFGTAGTAPGGLAGTGVAGAGVAGTGIAGTGTGVAGTQGAAGVGVAGTGADVAGTGAGVAGTGAAGTGNEGVAGTGAAAGTGGDMVDPMTGLTAEQCIAAVMAAGTQITACEMCLCQPGNCQAELQALEGDAAANAMLTCVRTNNCDGTCCLCGAPCDPVGSNYAMGPCANEIETAAGVTPGAGPLANGATVQMNCATTGPADNSCAKTTRLGACLAMKCADMCSQPPACM